MQRIVIGTIGATGIVGVLILSGGFLKFTGLASALGDITMTAGVIIGITLGVLGVIAVIRRFH